MHWEETNNKRAFHWPHAARVYSCLQRFCSTLALSFTTEMCGGEGTKPDPARCLSIQVTSCRDCRGYVQAEEPCHWDYRKCSVFLPICHPNLGAVAKTSHLVGRNVEHWQDVLVPTARVKAAPVTTQSASLVCICSYFQGLMTALYPTSCSCVPNSWTNCPHLGWKFTAPLPGSWCCGWAFSQQNPSRSSFISQIFSTP